MMHLGNFGGHPVEVRIGFTHHEFMMYCRERNHKLIAKTIRDTCNLANIDFDSQDLVHASIYFGL